MPDGPAVEVQQTSPESSLALDFETFEIPYRADCMVRDALNYIKDQNDGSLTFRWSCRRSICAGANDERRQGMRPVCPSVTRASWQES